MARGSSNIKVLFTRELSTEQYLHAEKLDLQIESIPLISIKSTAVSKLKDTIEADSLVFTSRNAVVSIINSEGLQFFEKFKNILCLGKKTAEALHPFENKIHLPEEASSESLLQSILDNPEYKTILYPHGNLSDESFAESLREAGREVEKIVVYQTQLNSTEIDTSSFSAIVFQSPSAVKAFYSNQKNCIPSNTSIFVPGKFTEEAIKQYCKNKIVQSKSPNTTELLTTIHSYFQEANDSITKTT